MLNEQMPFVAFKRRSARRTGCGQVLKLSKHFSTGTLRGCDGVRVLRKNERVNVFHDEPLRGERAANRNAEFVIHSLSPSCGGETSHDSAAAGLRQSPRNTTAAAQVVARAKKPAVTSPSIIACHRPTDNVDKIADNCGRHAGETDRVEFGEAIQEIMNNVVRYADVTHRIDDRRQHVCQSHHGNVILGTRFFVLRHAEAIAA